MVLLESDSIQLGSKIKNFDLPNVDGTQFANKNLDKDLVLVAFICNHCPYVIKIADDFAALAKKYQDKVQFLAISSNDPDYREADSFENMQVFAQEHDFVFPYLFDETQAVAKDFGAVCTPDIFVYKKTGSDYYLAYHGRFDDLAKAFDELASKDELSFEQYPSIGCSIKWVGNSQ